MSPACRRGCAQAGGRVTTVGFFAEDSWQVSDALTLTGGVRADHWEIGAGRLIETDSVTGATTLKSAPPARGGWQPTARAGARGGAAGCSICAPRSIPAFACRRRTSFTGRSAPAPTRPRPIPFLQLEHARGAEGGFDWRPLPNAQLSVTGYANQLNGAIANVTLGTGPGGLPRRRLCRGRRQLSPAAEPRSHHRLWRRRRHHRRFRPLDAERHHRLGRCTVDRQGPVDRPRRAEAGASHRRSWPRARSAGPSGRVQASATLRYVSAQFDDDQNKRRIRRRRRSTCSRNIGCSAACTPSSAPKMSPTRWSCRA